MSDVLIQQLRAMYPNEPCGHWPRVAADEIERLQGEVTELTWRVTGLEAISAAKSKEIERLKAFRDGAFASSPLFSGRIEREVAADLEPGGHVTEGDLRKAGVTR